ncbi:hypothetical protein DOY81_000696 [Sarcophaga bullata]|nr:hypothetical protein DOY81_000696 [Sarcophaga bullata]
MNKKAATFEVLNFKGIEDKNYCRNHNKHHNYDGNVVAAAAAAAAVPAKYNHLVKVAENSKETTATVTQA